MPRYALIEAGGTKFVTGIWQGESFDDPAGQIIARHRIPTTTPAQTLGATLAWFAAQGGRFDAAGIASFGPLDLDRASPQWGHVRQTPKPDWSGADLVGPLAAALGCPVGIETDVNGAALAEARWGAGKGHQSLLYLTIGTGVGGGFVSGGRLLAGLSHPEMGHILLPRHPEDTGPDGAPFAGHCPFHGACLEGLAAGPSIIARWGASLSELPAGHQASAIIAWYLGRAVVSFQAVMDPARIVMGGGVMATPGLIDKVRAAAAEAGAGYFVGDPQAVVVAPGLGDNAGLLGALAVALEA